MIIPSQFTKNQNLIIRKMCQIQLESLQRIADKNDYSGEDIDMLLIRENVTEAEFLSAINEQMEKFNKLKCDPENLTVLSETDLSNFRHLLTNIEDRYKERYPKSISNLWNRLFLIEQTQNLSSFNLLGNN